MTDDLFTIEPVWGTYRYLLTGGRILDVRSTLRNDSNERGKVLDEAQRRWGGKKDDWKIEGVTRLSDTPTLGDAA